MIFAATTFPIGFVERGHVPFAGIHEDLGHTLIVQSVQDGMAGTITKGPR